MSLIKTRKHLQIAIKHTSNIFRINEKHKKTCIIQTILFTFAEIRKNVILLICLIAEEN